MAERLQQAPAGQPAQGVAEPRLGQFTRRDGPLPETLDQLPLAFSKPPGWRHQLGQAARGELPHRDLGRARRARTDGGGHGRCQHFADRVVIVVGRPAQQPEGLLVPQRRFVQDLVRGLQPRGRQLAALGEADHEAHRPATAQRHFDTHSPCRRVRATGGRQVVEGLPQPGVQGDLQNGLVAQGRPLCSGDESGVGIPV